MNYGLMIGIALMINGVLWGAWAIYLALGRKSLAEEMKRPSAWRDG